MITGSDARIHVDNVNDPSRASLPICSTTALEMPRLAYEQFVAKLGLQYALVLGIILHKLIMNHSRAINVVVQKTWLMYKV